MSTDMSINTDSLTTGHTDGHENDLDPEDGRHAAPTPDVEVRRNGVLFAVVGVAASLLALAYLVRAITDGGTLAWLFALALGALGTAQVLSWLDSRTPLLVADTFGIRLRLGKEWRGLPWSSLEQVVVEQRTSVLHDGRLVVVPASIDDALEGLDAKGRRQVAVSTKLYGAPLVVPLGMTTSVSAGNLVDSLADLAGGRSAVVELAGYAPEPVLPMDAEHLERWEARQHEAVDAPQGSRRGGSGQVVESRFERQARAFEGLSIFDSVGPSLSSLGSSLGHHAGLLVSRIGAGRSHDVDATPGDAPSAPVVAPATMATEAPPAPVPVATYAPPIALRDARPASRVDVRMEHLPFLGSAAPSLQLSELEVVEVLPESEVLHRPDGWGDTGWDITPEDTGWQADATSETVDVAAEEPEASSVPTIGPRISEARHQLGYGIDTLSERTRIRPHVIEAMEADDFTPCGGDFYARGHLRTIAGTLGLPAAELVEEYDARYASGPIAARRVFESELAGGTNGGLRRSLVGGRWAMVLGIALVLVLAWGVARLFSTDTGEVTSTSPVLNGSAGLAANQEPITSALGATVKMTVRAVRAPAQVVVRDQSGKILFSGALAQGAQRRLVGVGPFTVRASNPGAVDVWVAGKTLGSVGDGTVAAARTFG